MPQNELRGTLHRDGRRWVRQRRHAPLHPTHIRSCTARVVPAQAQRFPKSLSTFSDPSSLTVSVQLTSGFGSWTGPSSNNSSLLAESTRRSTFEAVVSDKDTLLEIIGALPLFGDSRLTSVRFRDDDGSDTSHYTLSPANYSLLEAHPPCTRLRGSGEWRSQWFVEGLSPDTNYTALVRPRFTFIDLFNT